MVPVYSLFTRCLSADNPADLLHFGGEEAILAKLVMNVLSDGLSGKAGSAVFVRTKNGVYLRSHIVPKNPRTASQSAVRGQFAHAVSLWRGLTPAQANAWRSYAQNVVRVDVTDGTSRQLSGYTAFMALATKFLQVQPHGAVPVNPPAFGFIGDLVFLVASGGAGAVTFTASSLNSFSVRSELLLQRVAWQTAVPKPNGYRTQAFVGFVGVPLSATVTAPPGWYVPAYRFVNILTGQSTDRIVLPVVQVS